MRASSKMFEICFYRYILLKLVELCLSPKILRVILSICFKFFFEKTIVQSTKPIRLSMWVTLTKGIYKKIIKKTLSINI